MDELSILVGKRLRAAREKAGLSQVEVTNMLKYKSKGTVSGHESGASIPRPEELYKLSVLYNVSIDWLMGRSEYPHLDYRVNAMELTEKEKQIILAIRASEEKDGGDM